MDVMHGHVHQCGPARPAEVSPPASALPWKTLVARRTDPVPLGACQPSCVRERFAPLRCFPVRPRPLKGSKDRIVCSVAQDMKVLVKQHELGVIRPIHHQQRRMQINHVHAQCPVRFANPARCTVPLGCARTQHAQPHTTKHGFLFSVDEAQGTHGVEDMRLKVL